MPKEVAKEKPKKGKNTPKKGKTPPAKQPKKVQTSFGPKLKTTKPILATILCLVGLLHLVATIDYRSNQEGFLKFIPQVTRSTLNHGDLNLIGTLGSDIGFVSLYYCGLIILLLPFALFQFAYLFCQRRPKQVTIFQVLTLLITFITGAALFEYSNQQFWPNIADGFPKQYLPEGIGGLLGELAYDTFLKDFLGAFGSGLVLLVLFLAAFYYTFQNSLKGLYRWVSKIPVPNIKLPKFKFPERKAPISAPKEPAPKTIPLELEKPEAEASASSTPKKQRKLFGSFAKKQKIAPVVATPKPGIQYQENNKPNEQYLDEIGKAIPEPQPLPNSGKPIRKKPPETMVPATDPVHTHTPQPDPDPVHTPEPDPEPIPLPPTPKPISKAKVTPTPEPQAVEDPHPQKVKIVASEKTEKDELTTPKKKGKYKFPPVDILDISEEEEVDDTTDHQAVAERLKQTLEEFKIKVELGEVHIGPVITRYDLHPAPGVRVEKIAALEKNLTMALQAQSVRILAPVPGKGCVGIEIPNKNPQSVRVRDILETKIWTSSKAEIPVVLGKDVSGKPLVTDLTKMPHLLIAGSTGSGKTVCINAIISSLLYHASPDDLRFIMVDPKIVEMKVFNDLPHMLIPVVTDPKKVPNALKWLISEMENRYQIFAKAGVRNIAGFNAKILKDREAKLKAQDLDASLTAEERTAVHQIEVERDDDALEIPEKKLPYIVCIIDELADLMMVAPADIETCVARLAQLARAAGIHLVIATQRPSVNVITGVIKANLPSRISFKVASKIDSRTILDGSGADTLIGRGDMLFIPPGAHELLRAQGAFVSDDEIADVVDYLKVNGPPEILEEVQKQIEFDPDDDGGPTTTTDGEDWGDALVPDAIQIIFSAGKASTSFLQRRMSIGYNRAARIMDILEERGIVGPENGSKGRDVIGDPEEWL